MTRQIAATVVGQACHEADDKSSDWTFTKVLSALLEPKELAHECSGSSLGCRQLLLMLLSPPNKPSNAAVLAVRSSNLTYYPPLLFKKSIQRIASL